MLQDDLLELVPFFLLISDCQSCQGSPSKAKAALSNKRETVSGPCEQGAVLGRPNILSKALGGPD